jgi:ferrochelatase
LVELDIEYQELAHEAGVTNYIRVPTLRTHPKFIEAMAELCRNAKFGQTCPNSGNKICPQKFNKCPASC